jgi:hypothetical protein
MEETQMVVRKKVEGRVDFNDGEFAEVQTVGIEGIELNLLLETIQIHREDTNDTPDEFQRRFPVGMWLDILTTTEITAQPAESSLQNDGDEQGGKWQGFIQ